QLRELVANLQVHAQVIGIGECPLGVLGVHPGGTTADGGGTCGLHEPGPGGGGLCLQTRGRIHAVVGSSAQIGHLSGLSAGEGSESRQRYGGDGASCQGCPCRQPPARRLSTHEGSPHRVGTCPRDIGAPAANLSVSTRPMWANGPRAASCVPTSRFSTRVRISCDGVPYRLPRTQDPAEHG